MFYEVRPSLIFLARLLGGLVVDMFCWHPGDPGVRRGDLTARPRAATHGHESVLMS